MSFIDSNLFIYGILPIIIFFARIADVSIGTVRIMQVSRGNRNLAAFLAFIEVMLWLLAITVILNYITNIFALFGYCLGFSMGTFIGIFIEEKLAIGKLIVRIVSKKDVKNLTASLNDKGYGFTKVDAEGATGKVNIVYTIIKRKELENVVYIIQKFNPKAFYSAEEVKTVHEGIFPVHECYHKNRILRRLKRK